MNQVILFQKVVPASAPVAPGSPWPFVPRGCARIEVRERKNAPSTPTDATYGATYGSIAYGDSTAD